MQSVKDAVGGDHRYGKTFPRFCFLSFWTQIQEELELWANLIDNNCPQLEIFISYGQV